MEDNREIGPVDTQPGDWSIWPLAEDKIVPESFGWHVVVAVNEQAGNRNCASWGVGGFTDTSDHAEEGVRLALAIHNLGVGRRVEQP